MRRIFYYWLGLGILFANKVRYAIAGYRRPREFSVTNTKKAIAYDREVVDRWRQALEDYLGEGAVFSAKRVFEIGPGADLGVALMLLAEEGAQSYAAIDINNLIAQTPRALYEDLFASMRRLDSRVARQAFDDFTIGHTGKIRYVHDQFFSFKDFADSSFDRVVSNAALEHVDDVPRTLREIDRVTASGGVACLHVDLQTHTRVIRDRDPLNIYRYSRLLYRLAKFSGIPNRIRPHVYQETLEKLGWQDIRIVPVITLADNLLKRDQPGLARHFRQPEAQMEILSFMLLARKP